MRLLYRLLTISAAMTAICGCSRHHLSENAIFSGDRFTVFPDSVVDGEHMARAVTDLTLESTFPDETKRTLHISMPPEATGFRSKSRLVNAVHNMSLAQLDSVTAIGSTARTAYTVELALAYMDPDRAMGLLRGRVSDGIILQGRSRGGGWPVATDAIAWAAAAWSIYEVTGSKEWLAESYAVIKATLDRYEHTAYDHALNLVTGMSTSCGNVGHEPYPDWMTEADIAQSASLTVNALTTRAYAVMARMAQQLNDSPKDWQAKSDSLRESLNTTLWMPNVSGYSHCIYGQPYPIASAVLDNLGQALCMTYDIATPEMSEAILEHTPVLSLGIPAMYPQMPDTTLNPSNALVPAIEGFWAIAAARTSNMAMLYRSLYSLVRTAAMNLGNYPFVDINTGHIPPSVARQRRDAVSAAANIAAIYRGVMGMRFMDEGMELRPLIASGADNEHSITGFRYRGATLDINVSGTGSIISSFRVDSIEQQSHIIPPDLTGHHTVEIAMAGNTPRLHEMNLADNASMPPTPAVYWDMKRVGRIRHFVQGDAYEVYVNGVLQEQIFGDRYQMFTPQGLTSFCLVPVRAEEFIGFSSRPDLFMPQGWTITIPADSLAYPGTSLIADRKVASRFAETTESRRSRMSFNVNAPADGTYLLRVTYSNGLSDPQSQSDFCAIRMVTVGDSIAGTLVMPPTGKDKWTETSQSNFVRVNLRQGLNRLSIIYRRPWCVNGHRTLNTALIERVTLTRL